LGNIASVHALIELSVSNNIFLNNLLWRTVMLKIIKTVGILEIGALALVVVSGCMPQQYPGVTAEEDPTLPDHSIYRPADLSALNEKLPIVVWGEGACGTSSTVFGEFLAQIAHANYFVIANNGLVQFKGTTSDMLLDAIDWAITENSREDSKYFDKIDTTKIAMMGQSCGGLEALHAGDDPRISTVVAWNSGIFDTGSLAGATKADLKELHTPTLWVNGGPKDIAYPQAAKDFAQVPATVPAVWANYDLTERGGSLFGAHMGTFWDPNGGAFAQAGILWLDFTLKGIEENKAYFIGTDCGLCANDPKWSVSYKNWD